MTEPGRADVRRSPAHRSASAFSGCGLDGSVSLETPYVVIEPEATTKSKTPVVIIPPAVRPSTILTDFLHFDFARSSTKWFLTETWAGALKNRGLRNHEKEA